METPMQVQAQQWLTTATARLDLQCRLLKKAIGLIALKTVEALKVIKMGGAITHVRILSLRPLKSYDLREPTAALITPRWAFRIPSLKKIMPKQFTSAMPGPTVSPHFLRISNRPSNGSWLKVKMEVSHRHLRPWTRRTTSIIISTRTLPIATTRLLWSTCWRLQRYLGEKTRITSGTTRLLMREVG